MSRVPARIIAISLAALALSGCQSFPLTAWMFKKPHSADPSSVLRPMPELAGAQVLEEGRAQLRAGHISAAIASFRVARFDPATAADANNGLGVAYIRLGRRDIADRYFSAALELQPDNERFAANLLRLRTEVMMAQRAHTSDEAVVARAEERTRTERSQELAQETRARAVYHIATVDPTGEAPNIEVVQFAVNETQALPKVEAAEGSPEQESSGPRMIQIAQ